MNITTSSYVAAYQNSAQAVSNAQTDSRAADKIKAVDKIKAEKTKTATDEGATVEISGAGRQALSDAESNVTDTSTTSRADQIKGMSESDRSALVTQMKADQESYQAKFIEMVQDMMSKQTSAYGQSTDSIWKFLASGKFTVDADTKAAAQESISEDGYYGVKQTSQRMFDFAMALTGGDTDKMQEMKDAVQKGYEKATATWGQSLPEICKQTMDATNKLFDDYLKGTSESTTEATETE